MWKGLGLAMKPLMLISMKQSLAALGSVLLSSSLSVRVHSVCQTNEDLESFWC